MALDIDVSQMQIDLYEEMEIRRNADSDLNDKVTAVETEVVNSRTSPTQSYATLPNRLDDMENRLSTVELGGGGSGGGDVEALRNYIDQQDAKKADVSHTHSASDVTGGTLSVARGGTGKSSITTNNLIVGNGTSTPKEIAPKQGALYATSTSAVPEFGALPVNCGGTGATTAAAARTALGLGTAATLSPNAYVTATKTGTAKDTWYYMQYSNKMAYIWRWCASSGRTYTTTTVGMFSGATTREVIWSVSLPFNIIGNFSFSVSSNTRDLLFWYAKAEDTDSKLHVRGSAANAKATDYDCLIGGWVKMA